MWYIKQNIASPYTYYWNGASQCWTSDCLQASIYERESDAEGAAKLIDSTEQIIVCRKRN